MVRPGDQQRSTATCRYAEHRGNASKPATYLDRPRYTDKDDRLPTAVLYVELWQTKRDVGRPHLYYRDCTKRQLHAADINKKHWGKMAQDRSAWNIAVKKEHQKPKPKEQPMPKSNDIAAMKVRSRLQIQQISSQCSHADTA